MQEDAIKIEKADEQAKSELESEKEAARGEAAESESITFSGLGALSSAKAQTTTEIANSAEAAKPAVTNETTTEVSKPATTNEIKT